MAKKKFYAVVKGRKPGIYDLWFGKKGAEVQIKGFTGAEYKGFATLADAEQWYRSKTGGKQPVLHIRKTAADMPAAERNQAALTEGKVVMYTDGGAINNPGPGGYGVVLLSGKKRQEFSGGFLP